MAEASRAGPGEVAAHVIIDHDLGAPDASVPVRGEPRGAARHFAAAFRDSRQGREGSYPRAAAESAGHDRRCRERHDPTDFLLVY